MLLKDYFPIENEGITVIKAAEADPKVIFKSGAILEIDFTEVKCLVVYYGSHVAFSGPFIILVADDLYDYEIRTSLN
jgi:hypothetical protein